MNSMGLGKNKKWVLAVGILGFTSYGAYRAYNSPAMVKKRERFLKLIGSIASIANLVSDSAESAAVISRDFKDFIQSDSNQVPNSLKQISKLAKSDEVSEPLVRITSAITRGILQGYQHSTLKGDSSCIDHVLDRFFTDSGSGFASVVVGSFAKNLVLAVFSDVGLRSEPRWVNNVLCDENFTELIENCVQIFVSTAVAVYLEKTMSINTYDEICSGLTNPKHKTEVKDVLVSVCRGAMETFVKTSHQVLSNSAQRSRKQLCWEDPNKAALVDRMCSSLSVPRNRRLVLDLTGRVTFETMKSFQEFVVEKVSDGLRKRVDYVHDKVGGRSAEALEFMRGKSSSAITACLSLCLHIVNSPWLLVPP